MKLSKNLLQAMTVGLALGAVTVTTSCDAVKENTEAKPQKIKCTDACDENCTSNHVIYDEPCPACGMG